MFLKLKKIGKKKFGKLVVVLFKVKDVIGVIGGVKDVDKLMIKEEEEKDMMYVYADDLKMDIYIDVNVNLKVFVYVMEWCKIMNGMMFDEEVCV